MKCEVIAAHRIRSHVRTRQRRLWCGLESRCSGITLDRPSTVVCDLAGLSSFVCCLSSRRIRRLGDRALTCIVICQDLTIALRVAVSRRGLELSRYHGRVWWRERCRGVAITVVVECLRQTGRLLLSSFSKCWCKLGVVVAHMRCWWCRRRALSGRIAVVSWRNRVCVQLWRLGWLMVLLIAQEVAQLSLEACFLKVLRGIDALLFWGRDIEAVRHIRRLTALTLEVLGAVGDGSVGLLVGCIVNGDTDGVEPRRGWSDRWRHLVWMVMCRGSVRKSAGDLLYVPVTRESAPASVLARSRW